MPPRLRKMAARRPTIASGRPKRPPRRSGRLYRFPSALRGFQDGPWKATKAVNTAHCAFKTAEDGSKTAQDGLRWPQKCSQMPPKTTSLREDPQAPREATLRVCTEHVTYRFVGFHFSRMPSAPGPKKTSETVPRLPKRLPDDLIHPTLPRPPRKGTKAAKISPNASIQSNMALRRPRCPMTVQDGL